MVLLGTAPERNWQVFYSLYYAILIIQRTFMNQMYFLMYMKGRTHNDEAIEKMLNEL